ncbi:MAG TPA: hypothetical protein VGX97_11615 [bacterium]|nr:hypothetical protein [bacterium]
MNRHAWPRRAGLGVVCAAVLALSAVTSAGAQTAPSDATALAVPVSGRIVITDMGKAQTRIVPTPVVSSGSTTQREDLDITLPVLGIPLEGQTSLTMEAHMTMVLVSATTVAQGKADHVVLHGPAGDATVSVVIDQPVQGMGGYDPADATVHIRGAGGTGMFAGVRIQGDLKGAFKPAGTLYLGYPSPDAAVAAVQRGLAQNASLSDPQRAALLDQARQAAARAPVDLFPPDATAVPAGQAATPPPQAVVTSAVRRAGAQTQLVLRIVVPQGAARQPVRIVVVDGAGSQRTVDLGMHAPGDAVSGSASGTAPFVVLVYVNDAMVRQISVPAQ